VKNVKPILKDVKVMLNSEMDNYVNGFPGSPRTGRRSPQAYNCTTCHGANHPYFKMSTFTNDEEFCREALSRIDYENFYQSLIIRGINGTGNHPKFVFVEKFYKNPADANNFKVHNLGSDFNLNLHVGGNGMASNIVPGPMMIWTYQEIISHPGYAVLNSTQQAQARARAGRLKRLDKRNLSLDILNYNWYIPEVHNPIIYGQNGAINNLSAFDVAIPVGGSLDGDRTKEPVVYDVLGFVDGGLPATSTLGDMDGLIPLSAPFKTFVTNGQPGFDRANLDYNSTTTLKDGPQVMNDNWEFLRDYYREVVIDWIRRENSSRNQ
jgi:hypothetical protein